jgi:hypothetical protein
MVTKLALECTIVSAPVAHDGRSVGVSSHLKGILELNPMWIFGNGYSVKGRFVVFCGVKVKTKDRKIGGRIAKIVTNVNFLDTDHVEEGRSDHGSVYW